MALLIAGLALFIVVHLVPTRPSLRAGLVGTLGPGIYRGLFALVSIAGLVLIVLGYGHMQGPGRVSPPRHGKRLKTRRPRRRRLWRRSPAARPPAMPCSRACAWPRPTARPARRRKRQPRSRQSPRKAGPMATSPPSCCSDRFSALPSTTGFP
ncbi:MAG: hypothetical protein E6G91_13380 [Alphaproteobacteria bacterium]|nr:MAG: hypothetical protein E6G91_13380 [Alphaproteobacteria bacterium]